MKLSHSAPVSSRVHATLMYENYFFYTYYDLIINLLIQLFLFCFCKTKLEMETQKTQSLSKFSKKSFPKLEGTQF